MLRVPAPSWFSWSGGLDSSEKEIKTPTLPKAGRVGHPENLNRYMGAAVLWCHHPLARFLQLKTLGRICHPPNTRCVILSRAKNLSAIFSASRELARAHGPHCENVSRLHHGQRIESPLHRCNGRPPAPGPRAQGEESSGLYCALTRDRVRLLRGIWRYSHCDCQRKTAPGVVAVKKDRAD